MDRVVVTWQPWRWAAQRRRRRALAAMHAAYAQAAQADRAGRAAIVRLVEEWDDDEPGPAAPDRLGDGSPVWNATTQPLPLGDGRPFMTPGARRWAAPAERHTPRRRP